MSWLKVEKAAVTNGKRTATRELKQLSLCFFLLPYADAANFAATTGL